MQDDPSSPFFTELLGCLQRNVEGMESGAVGEKEFAEIREKIKSALSPSSADAPMLLSEILENYQHLFGESGPVHIDQKLYDAFSQKEFALKIYRGLPRVYHRDNPSKSRIKKDFSHLPSLKRLAAERFLFPLYEKDASARNAKICLFTWVISDGWGDWIAAREARTLLREKFPESTIEWVALVPKGFEISSSSDGLAVPYEKELSASLFPEEALQRLRSADLIFSFPTFFPQMNELVERLQRIEAPIPFPRIACVGQYGYIESSWFHPKSKNRSMGLHFLEKGILIRKPGYANFSQIENEKILLSLFETATPGPMEVEKFLETKKFYLAYLVSPVGGAVYLHALLKANEHEEKPIDICTPDIGWFVRHVERQKKEGKPLLEGNFGVREIEVHYEEKIHRVALAEGGKTVRLLCPGNISDADFRLLVRLSDEFVGVRGDQSLSEAVSANRAFFYDGALHARYFVKDLLALAENRLAPHRSAQAVFRGMGKTFLHNLPEEEGEWVDETFFQEKEPWVQIAMSIGGALQDPDALAGFKKFNRILAEEHSFNEGLCQLLRRELAIHKGSPFVELEEKQLSLFAEGKLGMKELIHSLETKRGLEYERPL